MCQWISVIKILWRFDSDVKIAKCKLNKFLFHQKKIVGFAWVASIKTRLILLKSRFLFVFPCQIWVTMQIFKGFFDLNNVDQSLQSCYHFWKVPKFTNLDHSIPSMEVSFQKMKYGMLNLNSFRNKLIFNIVSIFDDNSINLFKISDEKWW